MLTKFSVSNFKGFQSDFTLTLKDANGYTFNQECIKDGVVNTALIYGHNGVGKSNLGLALFDIISHLTENNTIESEYDFYLNAYSRTKTATFSYEFLIDSTVVTYEYEKEDREAIISESFSIGGELLAHIDRNKEETATFNLKGTESLNRKVANKGLSILKYIKNNSVLEEDSKNTIFLRFFDFIEGMLFFRSLEKNAYIGLEIGRTVVLEDIIEKDNIKDFEAFLNKAGVECALTVVERFDKNTLAFEFKDTTIPFESIASQGTRALTIFYFWLQRVKEENKVSFLFIDEFDAFYHHELSALIVEELKKTGIQFILTTHNTSIITNDLLRPDCYFLMNKENIRSLAKSTSKELREAHNIEKMYKANTFHV